MKRTLTAADYQGAAWYLACDEAAIRAVAEVESRGQAFLPTGEPAILFERHIFHRLTAGKWSDSHPHISNRSPGGYGRAADQHARLAEAAALNREAALSSASYGIFQIMAFNHERAGHPTLQGFINAMYAGADWHLRAFVSFVAADPRMAEAIRSHYWQVFAKLYNGKNFAINRYDSKLAAAYEKWQRELQTA